MALPSPAVQFDCSSCGWFPGALVVGALTVRARLFGVYTRAPDCWKLSYATALALALPRSWIDPRLELSAVRLSNSWLNHKSTVTPTKVSLKKPETPSDRDYNNLRAFCRSILGVQAEVSGGIWGLLLGHSARRLRARCEIQDRGIDSRILKL